MCEHGKQRLMPFNPIRRWQDWASWMQYWTREPLGWWFSVDECLADDVTRMNTQEGITTLHSCCGHGEPFAEDEGEILIDSHSVVAAIKAGYDVRVYHRVWNSEDGAEIERPTYEIKLHRD